MFSSHTVHVEVGTFLGFWGQSLWLFDCGWYSHTIYTSCLQESVAVCGGSTTWSPGNVVSISEPAWTAYSATKIASSSKRFASSSSP